jgi:hypothetical protein
MRARRYLTTVFGLTLVTCVASGCDFFHGNSNSSSTAPTAIVEKFSGSLKQTGSVIFSFNTSQDGMVDVTLTTMVPASSSTVALGIGTGTGTDNCPPTNSASAVAAGSTPQLSVNEKAGPYCVKVTDNTTTPLTQTATVTVTVSHQ